MNTPINTSIDGKTQLYGLVGNPVAHSISPAFQCAAFSALSINAVYIPFLISSITAELKSAFKQIGMRGFNVTLPHKTSITSLLDDIDPKAEFIRSVNTVVIRNGIWKGYSTDGSGFICGLSNAGISVSGKKVQLLGAGGSSIAIANALLENNIKELYIFNRTAAKAEELIQRLKTKFDTAIHLGICQEKYDLLVNTTSVGLNDNSLPCEESLIKNAGFISDIIYKKTMLLKMADEYGILNQNGLEMLLYQGAESFTLWTGKPAPVFTMRNALNRAILPQQITDPSRHG